MSNTLDIKATDIDALFEEAVGKIDLAIADATIDPDAFFSTVEGNGKAIAALTKQKEMEARRDMVAAQKFSSTLLHGDGTNAKAPSRIRNRILSRT